jgi:LEA14-like dessication related protein
MKMTNLFALGLLGFGIWMFIRKSSVAKNVLFSFEKLDADIRKQKILMTMGVYNPTTTPIEFNSVVGALLLNGKQIALVESFQQTTIEPTAKTNILITLRPSVVGIFQTIQDIVKAKLKGVKLSASFVGSANIDGITFPVETKLA